jgi:hypothetical protein
VPEKHNGTGPKLSGNFREDLVDRRVHIPKGFLVDSPFTAGQLDRNDFDLWYPLFIPG